MLVNTLAKTGDCDFCDKVGVLVTARRGDWMCDSCIALEDAAVKHTAATKLLEESKKIDQSIKLQGDVYNTATVAFVELQAAINADPTLSDDEKKFKIAITCQERIKHLQQVVFESQNAIRAWQMNGQEAASQLRADLRAKFEQFDVTYKPAPVAKPKAVKAPQAKVDKAVCLEMAKKYNVPAVGVESMVKMRKISPEQAAQELAKLLKK